MSPYTSSGGKDAPAAVAARTAQRAAAHGAGFLAGLFGVFLAAILYAATRAAGFMLGAHGFFGEIAAGGLLIAEALLLWFGAAYFRTIYKAVTAPGRRSAERLPPDRFPSVAVVMPSHHEPIPVISRTLGCISRLTYPNKYLYCLDDTRYEPANSDPELWSYRLSVDETCGRLGVHVFRRQWHHAKAGILNDWLKFSAGEWHVGFDFQCRQPAPRRGNEKYLVIFDADMNPEPDVIEELVCIMESDPRLAFVQTPHRTANYHRHPVAAAYSVAQEVFYRYVCPGKSLQNAAFSCGSNVIFRAEALRDIGGFDQSTVTEDFFTSFKLHRRGWHSAFHPRVTAVGLAPQELGGFLRQQFRWALGTTALLRTILRTFMHEPRALSGSQWFEYAASASYYFLGWAYLFFALLPTAYLLCGVPPLLAEPLLTVAAYAPYLIFTYLIHGFGMRQRPYGVLSEIRGMMLALLTFPTFVRPSLLGILGVKGSFTVTPKEGSSSIPLSIVWPQLGLSLLSLAAVAAGSLHILRAGLDAATALHVAMALMNCVAFGSVLYFNGPERHRSGLQNDDRPLEGPPVERSEEAG